MTARARHAVFVSMAVRREDAILLVQESKPDVRGRWSLPGGHLEPGESLADGACREVREETGLIIERPTGLLRVLRGRAFVWFVFAAETRDPELVAGDEILACRWFNLDDAAALRDEDLVHARAMREILAAAHSWRPVGLEGLVVDVGEAG
jgi:ADP-ribose pyrophosphatase YjhB (NUDIX family)